MSKNRADVEYYVPGRKRRVASSTKAVSDFLAILHEQNPTATILELHSMITDRRQFIRFPEAIAVLEAHINSGHGAHVPNWK